MLPTVLLIAVCLLPAAVLGQGQTIAQYLASVSGKSYQLTRAAAVAAQNPGWGTAGSKTLFVPTDASNPPSNNRAGTLFTSNAAINYRNTTYYQIINDDSGAAAAVYDNYDQQNTQPTEIRLRYGTGVVRVIDYYQASNGYVYVIDGPIPDLPTPSQVFASSSLTISSFGTLLSTSGLESAINNLRGVTIFAPSNSAIAAIQSQLGGLTPDQVTAIVQNHILRSVLYSTALNSGTVTSYLGTSLALVTGRNNNTGEYESSIGGGNFVIPSDSLSTAGPIHIIDRVLIPNPIPAAVSFPNSGSQSTTTASGSATRTTATSTATGTNKPNAASVVTGLEGLLTFGFAWVAGLFI